jgi:hypothetical protein
MKQRTLAMLTGFEQYTRKRGERYFWKRWSRVVPWRELCGVVDGDSGFSGSLLLARRVASIDPMKALRAD